MFERLLTKPRDERTDSQLIAFYEYEAHDFIGGRVRGRVPAFSMDEARAAIKARGYRFFVAWPEGQRPETGWSRIWLPGKARGATVVGDFETADNDHNRIAARYRTRGVVAMGLMLLLMGTGMIVLWAMDDGSFGLVVVGAILAGLGIVGCTLRMSWSVAVDKRRYAICSSFLGLRFRREIDLTDAKGIRVGLDSFLSADGDYRAYNVSAVMPNGEYVPLFVGGPNAGMSARRIAKALNVALVSENA